MKYKIAEISDNIVQDPVLIETMKIIFNWANERGLKGEKVSDLKLFHDIYNPLKTCIHLYCEIEKNKDD